MPSAVPVMMMVPGRRVASLLAHDTISSHRKIMSDVLES